MKKIGIASSLVFLSCSCIGSLQAQDDETRQIMGLPIMIGQNSSNRNSTTLSGRITVKGLDPSKPRPVFFVAVYWQGSLIDRRQTNDTGVYFVPSVPRENSILSVEIGGIEIGRYQLMPAVSGNLRHDVTLDLAQVEQARGKTGVVSVRDFYERTDENQKLFDKAMAASREKKMDNAVSLYTQIIKNDPKDFVALSEMGTLYFRNEKYPQAEEYYNKALEQKPDFSLAQINLGKMYLAQKDPEKAITVLSKAVETDPKSADIQHFLGEAYLQVKKGSKAVVHLNEAIKLAPLEKADIHLRLAQLYNGANLKDKAAEEYKQYLAKVPEYKDKDKLEKYIKENAKK